MATPRYTFAKTFFVKKKYSAANLGPAQKLLLQMPNTKCIISINSEQGAIRMRRANESSYVHRDALFNFKVQFTSTDVKDVAPSKSWTKKFVKSLQFLDSGETYQNYPDREQKDYLKRFYGNNLDRLIEIKKKWDPKGYFNSRMSLPIE